MPKTRSHKFSAILNPKNRAERNIIIKALITPKPNRKPLKNH